MFAIRMMRRLRSDKRGATAIEYGLIVALIGVAIIGSLSKLGGGANGMWTQLDETLETSM
jgi:pilus assembly protein Flp/PilA